MAFRHSDIIPNQQSILLYVSLSMHLPSVIALVVFSLLLKRHQEYLLQQFDPDSKHEYEGIMLFKDIIHPNNYFEKH